MLNKVINLQILVILFSLLLQVEKSFADTTPSSITYPGPSLSTSQLVAPTPPRDSRYSCIAGTGFPGLTPAYNSNPGLSDVANLAVKLTETVVTSIALQSSTSISMGASFSMLDPNAEGEVQANGGIRCDVPTPDIRFCYKPGKLSNFDPSDCTSLSYNPDDLSQEQRTTFNGMTFVSHVIGDKLCVFYGLSIENADITQFWPAGCKTMKDPTFFSIQSSCQVPMSCIDRSEQYSRNMYPVSGAIVQCFRETILNSVFSSCCANDNTTTKSNMFFNFQSAMRDTVRLMLMLYIIFQGIKISLAGEMPKKHEVIIFGLKFALVVYFSVGFVGPNISQASCNLSNKGATDGITSYVLPGLLSLTDSLSDIMIQSRGTSEMCQFDTSLYDSNYAYLALWDTIDCKILYYLGAVNGSGAVSIVFSLLKLVLGLLFSGLIIHAILIIMFSAFIIGIMVYVVHFYLLSLFSMILLIYMAPIFVPLALFEKTKSFFQSWSRLILSFSLQPVIVVTFVSVMLTIFDSIMYGTCAFTKQTVTSNGITYDQFLIASSSSTDSGCTLTFGYPILLGTGGVEQKSFLGGIVTISLPTLPGIEQIKQVLSLTGFAFLFFSFCQTIGGFAADLTGGAPIQAKNMIAEAMGKAFAGVKGATKNSFLLALSAAKTSGSALRSVADKFQNRPGGGGG